MSFLSVKLSKADSMAAVSVLLSTTRKFFCASAPAVMCYRLCEKGFASIDGSAAIIISGGKGVCMSSRCNLRRCPRARGPLQSPVFALAGCGARVYPGGGETCLVADDGEELPVFEVGVRSHCEGGQWRF